MVKLKYSQTNRPICRRHFKHSLFGLIHLYFKIYNMNISHRIANKFVDKMGVKELRVGAYMKTCPSWFG